MDHQPEDRLTWYKGRICDANECVEIAPAGDDVMLRSSVAPDATLTLSRAEWLEFLAGAKEGLFDHL